MTPPLPRSILVVGSGGREHTIVTACLNSPAHPRVLAAPGNGGIARDVKCFPVPVDDIPGLVALAKKERIEFVIVPRRSRYEQAGRKMTSVWISFGLSPGRFQNSAVSLMKMSCAMTVSILHMPSWTSPAFAFVTCGFCPQR